MERSPKKSQQEEGVSRNRMAENTNVTPNKHIGLTPFPGKKPRSRFGEKPLKTIRSLSPKRDCRTKPGQCDGITYLWGDTHQHEKIGKCLLLEVEDHVACCCCCIMTETSQLDPTCMKILLYMVQGTVWCSRSVPPDLTLFLYTIRALSVR